MHSLWVRDVADDSSTTYQKADSICSQGKSTRKESDMICRCKHLKIPVHLFVVFSPFECLRHSCRPENYSLNDMKYSTYSLRGYVRKYCNVQKSRISVLFYARF